MKFAENSKLKRFKFQILEWKSGVRREASRPTHVDRAVDRPVDRGVDMPVDLPVDRVQAPSEPGCTRLHQVGFQAG